MRTFIKSILLCVFLIGLLFIQTPTINASGVRSTQEISNNAFMPSLNLDSHSLDYFSSILNAFCVYITGGLSKDKELGYNQNSATGAVAQLIDYTVYQKPLSSTEYVADVFQKFNIAQPAYAQGVGFSGLQPVLKVWKAFRNIAYFAYVVIFVIVGFMIMFRAKLNPQTVVNLQEALPNLVITLILITFSYAIAGFVIDLIYLSIYVITGLLDLGGLIVDGQLAAKELLGHNIVYLGWQYMMGPLDSAGIASRSIGVIVRDIFSQSIFGGYPLAALSSVIAYLIIALAVLINMVRALFTLLKAYIGIIISTIFAPIQLLMNAIPGSNAFQTWINELLANAIVFPAAALMILIGIILVGPTSNVGPGEQNIQVEPGVGFTGSGIGSEQSNPGGFVPPLVLPGNVGTLDSLQAIIGIGIIMLIPEVLEIVKEMFGVKSKLGELAWKNTQSGVGPVAFVGKGIKAGGVGATEAYLTNRFANQGGTLNRTLMMGWRFLNGLRG